jgi:hypothetical protein
MGNTDFDQSYTYVRIISFPQTNKHAQTNKQSRVESVFDYDQLVLRTK